MLAETFPVVNSSDSKSKKCKHGCGGAYGGVWRNTRLAGFLSLAFGWQESGVSHHEDVSTLNLL
jgi:hypothetical protein